MFNNEYPYKSSESKTMRKSFKDLAKKIKKKYKPDFIIEIGSNDGAFLKNFSKNIAVGVEPCKNLARLTVKKKYKTFNEYWKKARTNEKYLKLKKEFKNASI